MTALIGIAVQLFQMVVPLLVDSDIMDGVLHSDKLTDAQKASITAMRKAVVNEWDSLAPTT